MVAVVVPSIGLQCFIKSLGNNSSEPSASDLEMQAKSNELEEEYEYVQYLFSDVLSLSPNFRLSSWAGFSPANNHWNVK